jgi:hypothetical protein
MGLDVPARREKLFASRWAKEELRSAVDPSYDVLAIRRACSSSIHRSISICCALRTGAVVVSRDTHFRLIPDLTVLESMPDR